MVPYLLPPDVLLGWPVGCCMLSVYFSNSYYMASGVAVDGSKYLVMRFVYIMPGIDMNSTG